MAGPGAAGESTGDPSFPERLGDFRLLRRIGGGGMGAVYRAAQESLGREVALKVIRPDLLHSEEARARFRREVETVARLKHPGIVPVYAVGEESHLPYFAMELLEGRTAGEILTALQGSAPERLSGRDAAGVVDAGADVAAFRGGWVDTCLRLVCQVALALEHAHGRGVLHRDIKPSNVMLTPDGRALLIDFGLAFADWAPAVTQPGVLLGSLAYMSPEQVRGEQETLDRRTDVYSLGVALYEMLTLQPPFHEEKDPSALHAMILDGGPRPPRALNRAVPRDVEIVCLKAMDRDPGRRYARAADLARDIENVLARRPIEAKPAGAALHLFRWTQRHPTWSVALILLVVGVLAFVRYQRAALRRSEAQRLIASASAQVNENPGLALLLAIEGARHQPGLLANNALRSALDALRERCTIHGHPGLMGAALSPDGTRVVTGGNDGTARVWEVASGREKMRLEGHQGAVGSVAFSPDGRMVATADGDGRARLWDAARGREIRSVEHGSSVGEVHFLARGRWLLTVGKDNVVRIWGADNGELIDSLRHAEDILECAPSPEGRTVLTRTVTGRVRAWTPGVKSAPRVVQREGSVRALAVSRDGAWMLTGVQGGTIRIEAVRTGEVRTTLPPEAGWETATFGPESAWVVVGSPGKRFSIWNARSGQREHLLGATALGFNMVGASLDGTKVFTVTSDRVVRIWDARTGNGICTLKGHGGVVGRVTFDPRGQRLLTLAEDQTARVWSVEPVLPRVDLHPPSGRVSSARISRDSARVALATDDGAAAFELATGKLLAHAHRGAVILRAVFSPDGALLATGSMDHTVGLWEVAGGREVRRLRGHTGNVWYAEFSPDGKRIATGSDDLTVRVWSVESGECLLSIAEPEPIGTVAFSPDGRRIVTGNVGGVGHVYDASTGRPLCALERHDGIIDRAVFGPRGETVATCSDDQTVRLWNARTGRELARMGGHRDQVLAVEFNPRGDLVVSASQDGTARVWSVREGAEAMTLQEHPSYVVYAAFSADGRWILTFDEVGTVRWWPVEPLPMALEVKPRDLTARERRTWLDD
ncbi:MAG: WD40 repeat domain-containing serine/threonine protein kinase [Planctomycetota bacterium]|jgi:WD40 repeat protein/tRNA A-37 threonylcarbamoyl transferase component Bud32